MAQANAAQAEISMIRLKGGDGAWVDEPTHHQNAAPPSIPAAKNTVEPTQDFREFQGKAGPPIPLPASVAKPSPSARIPQAPATTSRRWGKIRRSIRIENE